MSLTESIIDRLRINFHDNSLITNFIEGEQDIFEVAVKGSFFNVFTQNQRACFVKAVEDANIKND